ALGEMVANAGGNLPHIFDDAEVERATPHERTYRAEEALSQRKIASRGARANEGGSLPRQGARFVVRNGCVDRKRDRSDFRRWAEPQVDALHVTVLCPLLHELDEPAS